MKQFWVTFFGSMIGMIVGALVISIGLVFYIVAAITASAQAFSCPDDQSP